ncbi:caspase domain-containing protein [Armillaria novae-zelandiae]|uniref:Caspase domain-containing protein n=1 Tax=Armillaria novae-zelandiae TaxID=153914 RepID=A0AA39NC30_9AGAR|nr:caspase domain-containing protein [Armillaria novae-zelandiae]
MVNAEPGLLKKLISDALKESASTVVVLYRVRLPILHSTRIQSPTTYSHTITATEVLVDDTCEKLGDVTQNVANRSSDKPLKERHLDRVGRPIILPCLIRILRERAALFSQVLSSELFLPFLWMPGSSSKASPLTNINQNERAPRISSCRLHAVLIGIDAYESYPLRGCVSDALAMRQYLTEHLHVPEERIQCLLGRGGNSGVGAHIPSRRNIISALLNLSHNRQIETGDSIIIYFSGHGTSYQCARCHESIFTSEIPETECLKSRCPIEALCPMDHEALDTDGTPVPDISDREFNSIITQISHTKGHRITVILDCCHSTNLNRSFPEEGARAIPPLPRASFNKMLLAADQNMQQYPGYLSISDEDWFPNMNSHVILAPCREYQLTNERRGTSGFHGVFTQRLLDTLRSGRMGKDATYIDLIDDLPWSYFQTPVVAGERKNTRLWYQN